MNLIKFNSLSSFLDSLNVYSSLRQVNKYLHNLLEPIITVVNKNYLVFKGTKIKKTWRSNEQLFEECHYTNSYGLKHINNLM